ncbi:hypothetical protein [Nocardioides mangrovi]|uniref:DUF2384 domain-containing protein n=1 Tax=Nocardioides mangrovi TaxID=2874580 RepID=A0ABS7UBI4_9ACTN|nr:hypothetical protein [Nocardioides mangrovi]MBZ5738349.1 hypothetical protein [Nocardioides mangrovi]
MSERDSRYDVDLGQLLRDRHEHLRTELVATPWHSYETLAEVRGTSLDATRYAVHKAAQQHQLLLVPVEETVVVPAFQLDADGAVRTELLPVLELLLGAGMDTWRAWAWLTQPAALTLGRAPEEALTDPEMTDLVRHAAVRLAEHVR